jgi:hypothetical protein
MLFRIIAVLLFLCPFLQSQSTPNVGQPAPDFSLIDARDLRQTVGFQRESSSTRLLD